MTTSQLAVLFFLIINPIGNIPVVLSCIKDYPIERQRYILLREGFFSLILALFFLFLGERFLCCFQVKDYALTTSGGILLLLIALRMIFHPPSSESSNSNTLAREPFIVPIATPLLSGGALLTVMILSAQQEQDTLKLVISTLLAWSAIIPILVLAPSLSLLLGKRGLAALEQLMGMLLVMMAVNMLVKGMQLFLPLCSLHFNT